MTDAGLQSWGGIFRAIINDRELHARWLHTLSYMELLGAKKIAACIVPGRCSAYMLQHLAEESRHAYFFRSRIRDLGEDPDIIRPIVGDARVKWYLYRIDQFVVRLLRQSGESRHRAPAAYFLTTLAVELRAEWLYPLYEKCLREAGMPFTLRSLIREEEAHLDLVRSRISSLALEHLIPDLKEAEGIFFAGLSSGIRRDAGLAGHLAPHAEGSVISRLPA